MAESNQEAPFACEGLDRVFHEKARLGIMISLAGHADGLVFSDLKSTCGLTHGNLNRHLQVLEEAGYIRIEKGYEGRRPYTQVRLSAKGRTRFSDYLAVLEQVLRKARARTRINGSTRVAARQSG